MTESIQKVLQRALGHQQAGEDGQAAALYRGILEQAPDHDEALHLLGLAEQRLGDVDAALLHIAKAVGNAPEAALYRLNLGILLLEAGRPTDAAAMLRSALDREGNAPEAHYALGNALAATGDMAAALVSYRKSAALRPEHAQTLSNIGLILRERGDTEEAIDHLERAVRAAPPFPPAYSNLCAAYAEAGRVAEAVAAGRRAVACLPDDANAHYNLANALATSEDLEAAVESYREAVRIAPEFCDAWINLGVAYLSCDEPAAALEALDCARRLDKESADANWNRSLALLKLGRLAEGWPGYDHRWDAIPWLDRREFSVPQWRGETLEGQVVLIHAEQGYGDTIQFARYLPEVAQRGGRVRLACQPALKRLLASLPAVERVTGYGEPAGAFDFHLPIMSLPEAIGLEEPAAAAETIPYLSVPSGELQVPTENSLPKIGLVWRGSRINLKGMFRSCPLDELVPLLKMSEVRYFALQADVEEEERPLLAQFGVIDLSSDISDFADSASLTSAMDLVITVDTAQAHLAGALGKPVWTLLARGADWRWFVDRNDSPWYPTMRLFRQDARGKWSGPVERIIAALPQFLAGMPHRER